MDSTPNKILSSVLGLIGFLGSGVITGILYIFVVGKILDRGGDGFGLVGAIFMFHVFKSSRFRTTTDHGRRTTHYSSR